MFVSRAARLLESPTPAAAKQLAAFQRTHLGRQLELLTTRVDLEQTLAALVEGASGLTAEERRLLRATRPFRDPLDVLEAKIAGKTGLDETVESDA